MQAVEVPSVTERGAGAKAREAAARAVVATAAAKEAALGEEREVEGTAVEMVEAARAVARAVVATVAAKEAAARVVPARG